MTDIDGPRTSGVAVEVAVLFTDIEGSTIKWETDPVAMRVALSEHDALLTSAIAENGGRVLKRTGDGFLARFERVSDAAAAAVTAELALEGRVFSEVGGLRVRAAVDAGAVEERDGDLYGPV